MKFIIVILFTIFSGSVFAETLDTDNFLIDIERRCGEGAVTCENVLFTIRPTGISTTQQYTGTTFHSTCADGVTPCQFQGYKFIADEVQYTIYSSGFLEITDKEGNPLLAEQGSWND